MMKVVIKYDNVIYELSRTAAYAGVKRDDYERLSVTDADEALLRQYCREACGCMVRSLRSMVTGVDDGDSQFVAELRTSASFDDALSPTISGALQSYVALTALTRWLALAGNDASRDFSEVAATMLDDARSQLVQRKPPRRPASKQ